MTPEFVAEDYTCGCGLYVHSSRRKHWPVAIHIEGCPGWEPPQCMRRLEKGEVIRLTKEGPVYTVLRVREGAAYVKVGDWTTENGVLDGLESGVDPISAYAFVYRVAEEGEHADRE